MACEPWVKLIPSTLILLANHFFDRLPSIFQSPCPIFQPLLRGQIRVAKLREGCSGSIIRCTLQPTFISSSVKYEALSWCWGKYNPNTDPKIELDGIPFPVPANLYQALQQLRFEDRDRLIWCDKICIDQSNLDEKAEQVQIMADIYRNCNGLIVWVGEEADDSSQAIEVFRIFGECVNFDGDSIDTKRPLRRDYDSEEVRRVKKDARDSHWAAVNSFFNRSWFRRLWVSEHPRA